VQALNSMENEWSKVLGVEDTFRSSDVGAKQLSDLWSKAKSIEASSQQKGEALEDFFEF